MSSINIIASILMLIIKIKYFIDINKIYYIIDINNIKYTYIDDKNKVSLIQYIKYTMSSINMIVSILMLIIKIKSSLIKIKYIYRSSKKKKTSNII